MTKRKRGLVGKELDQLSRDALSDRAYERMAERHGDFMLFDAQNALNTGRGGRAWERAMDALEYAEDEEEIDRAFEAWLAPYINERVGTEQRVRAKSVRRGKYKRVKDSSYPDERIRRGDLRNERSLSPLESALGCRV
jgi:hypothetical protein